MDVRLQENNLPEVVTVFLGDIRMKVSMMIALILMMRMRMKLKLLIVTTVKTS